eukprot:COSAG05_NODE_344_length_11005_cov_35.313772_14_plen_115_part_00
MQQPSPGDDAPFVPQGLLQNYGSRGRGRHHYDTRETLQLRHNVEDLRNEVQRKLNMYTLGRKQVDLLCQRATSSNLKAVRRVDLRLEARGEQLEAMVDDMHEMRQEFEGAIAGC